MSATIEKLNSEIETLKASLAKLEAERHELWLAEIRKVRMIRNECSTTLVLGNRKINVSKNKWGRLTVKEGRCVIHKEFYGSIHDVRYCFATGAF